eukprot:jgi/Mesen1/7672/ME000401S07004
MASIASGSLLQISSTFIGHTEHISGITLRANSESTISCELSARGGRPSTSFSGLRKLSGNDRHGGLHRSALRRNMKSSTASGRSMQARSSGGESNKFESQGGGGVGGGQSTATTSPAVGQAGADDVDKLVDGISFGQLCNDFECVSSPSVEQTARQLARDIYDVKENKRSLSSFSAFVKYKDPLRSFSGREKYKRPSWILGALDKPSVAVLQMVMRSTSVLTIRWRLTGRPRIPPASVLVPADVTLTVLSTFTVNQISGQVIEHSDEWNLGGSSPPAAAYFWTSRLAWTVAETGRDTKEAIEGVSKMLQGKDEDGRNSSSSGNIYADPTDPRKFFQESNPNGEIYQIGLLIALIYLLVQFLKLTL